MSNRTSISGYVVTPFIPQTMLITSARSSYLQTFFVSVVALCVVCTFSVILFTLFHVPTSNISFADYMPIFFQGCKDASPVKSGVLALGFSSLALAALIAGAMVTRTQRYRPQMWTGWCLILIGMGLLSTLKAGDSVGRAVGFGVLTGVGLG